MDADFAPRVSKAEATECPACRYVEEGGEPFLACPRCGIIIKKYNDRLDLKQVAVQASSDDSEPVASSGKEKKGLTRPSNILKILAVVAILLAIRSYAPNATKTARISAGSPDLILAVKHEDPGKVSQLLLLGHDPNMVFKGKTPLEVALMAENIPIAGMLVEKGAKISPDRKGDRPSLLQECIGSNLTRSALFLLNQGVPVPDLTPHGISLLNLAAANGNMAIVRELINRGKSVNTRDRSGKTALMEASRVMNPEMVSFLIKNGADVNTHDSHFGYTPLLWGTKSTEVVKLLIDAGAKVNAKSSNGYTPLHSAVASQNPEAVMVLIESGADVTAKDQRGVTPLQMTTFSRNPRFPEIANLLRQAGAVE